MLLYWMRIQKLLYNSVLPMVRELTDLPDHLVIILPTLLRTFRPSGHHPADAAGARFQRDRRRVSHPAAARTTQGPHHDATHTGE